MHYIAFLKLLFSANGKYKYKQSDNRFLFVYNWQVYLNVGKTKQVCTEIS